MNNYTKPIQLALTGIRDAIKDKNNALAIEKCQDLLKADPNNYMCLVLLATAYQSTDKVQAAHHLRKAVNSFPKPIIALQKLAVCATSDELPEIYEKLLLLVPDNACEYHRKLLAVGKSNLRLKQKCINILKKQALIAKNTDTIHSLHLSLAKMWISQEHIDDADQKLFRSCLEVAISNHDSSEFRLQCLKRYLKLLYELSDYEKLIKKADYMFDLYPDEICSLEWICKVYCEICHSNGDFMSVLPMPIDFYAQKLQELNPESSLVVLVRAKTSCNHDEPIKPNYGETLRHSIQNQEDRYPFFCNESSSSHLNESKKSSQFVPKSSTSSNWVVGNRQMSKYTWRRDTSNPSDRSIVEPHTKPNLELDQSHISGLETDILTSSDQSNSVQADQIKPVVDRLSGAGKKRYNWLFLRGYSEEEARRIAKTPIGPKSKRRLLKETIEPKEKGSSRLCGAAHKRYKYLIARGYSAQDAKRIAKSPMDSRNCRAPPKPSASDMILEENGDRLSALGIKRMKKLIKHGFSYEEARRIAKTDTAIESIPIISEIKPEEDILDSHIRATASGSNSRPKKKKVSTALRGAAVKRCRKLVDHGYSYFEARRLAKSPAVYSAPNVSRSEQIAGRAPPIVSSGFGL